AIDRHLPLVAAQMQSRDRRWARRAPALYEDPAALPPVLRRTGRRCVFAFEAADGLRCGLHVTADAHAIPLARLKPSPCRLFPLALLRKGARTILTVSTGPVAKALGGPPARALACLVGPPVFE